MAKINLVCEHCGGNIILDNSHEVGTCEHCFSQFIVKEDKIIQNITQHVTKHVYGVGGKDVEELLDDAYDLIRVGDESGANGKFRQAINIDGSCWEAWLGYADTRGDGDHPLSMVPAYRKAYSFSQTEAQDACTFKHMTDWIPNSNMRSAFIRIYNISPVNERNRIFDLVSGVIGCDESEIARLAKDLSPDDWRAHLAMAQERQIRARWSKPEGLFTKRWPAEAEKVFGLFREAYELAAEEGKGDAVVAHLDSLALDNSYSAFANEAKRRLGVL